MQSVAQACRAVLNAAHAPDKVKAARHAARAWRLGHLPHIFDVDMPDRPARPDNPVLLSPTQMPKRRKTSSEFARATLLHALAHIEFSAIDLAFDLIGRFGTKLPREFVDDWMHVGADEAMHFALLDRRLRGLNSHYGALPAHAGLWEAAEKTAGDLLGRLAIVPMVLEARGLDVTPATITRFENQGDDRSAAILNRIYQDEIRHVHYGTKWFEYSCDDQKLDPRITWKGLVNHYFKGPLKGPFNDSARSQAGLTRDYYM